MPRITEQQRTQRREQVLAAAHREFTAQLHTDADTDAIAAAAFSLLVGTSRAARSKATK